MYSRKKYVIIILILTYWSYSAYTIVSERSFSSILNFMLHSVSMYMKVQCWSFLTNPKSQNNKASLRLSSVLNKVADISPREYDSRLIQSGLFNEVRNSSRFLLSGKRIVFCHLYMLCFTESKGTSFLMSAYLKKIIEWK